MKDRVRKAGSVRDGVLTTAIRTIADTLALTTSERRVLQFLLAGFILGLGVKLARDVFASPAKFDYSATDSTFAALSAAPGGENEDQTGTLDAELDAGPVRVNSASKGALMSLPGIGEVMAERIILERQDNGPFRSVEDLKRVRGIGSRRVEQLRPLVIID